VTNLEENNLIMSSTLSIFYLFLSLFLSCYIIRENAIAINFLRLVCRDEVPSKSLRYFAK